MASACLFPRQMSPLLSLPLRPLHHCAVPRIRVPYSRSNVCGTPLPPPKAALFPELAALQGSLLDLVRASPPTWNSAIASNLFVFIVGSPILLSGLTISGMGSAFLLGILSWRAFGPSGFLIVAAYFAIATAATKLKIAQKEALGIAEKRGGRRGPGSVVGSSASACVCALLSINNMCGALFARFWQLGFVACFCTKLTDTVSSEIGKAYGKTTYLATTFKVVPRGTEGAVSIEGTVSGVAASIVLAGIAYSMGQIANFGESLIGATLQDKDSFQWLNNDVVNIINISIGSILAMLLQLLILTN
ncbi:protein VTE6, chloroplastic-like isoform X2 [Zingiber officinale]|uniref:protein VTE6, chloroplastic-like isoform X2 n=1 Tax=Zingiber officinale TaxID=94328 RepID=UPI001C4AE6BC|nr:protein VTE6, chloroplastic-like isoform X2 [Zingiber officinale]